MPSRSKVSEKVGRLLDSSNHSGDKGDRGVLKPRVYFSSTRSLGIKWNFYFFAAFIKNGMHWSLHTQAAWFILHYLTALYPTLYTIIGCLVADESPEGRDDWIFPGSNLLSRITPGFFSTSAFFAIVFVLMFVVDVCFILCVLVPHFAFAYIRLLSVLQLFNIRVHLTFLPFVCAVLRHCLSLLVSWRETSPEWLILSVAYLLVFIVFLMACCFLHFIESNSIIKPSLMYEEWFSGTGFAGPFLLAIISLAGFGALHLPLKLAMTVLVSAAVICIAVAIFTLISMPMMMFLANELFVMKMLLKAYGLVASAMTLYFHLSGSMTFLFGCPVVGILAFAASHLILERKRKNARKLILQIEAEKDQMSTKSLNIALSSVDKNQFQLLVKESLLSGSRAVISPIFVRFCLERFKNSEWFLSYVVFLYSVIWGAEPEVYKFLLHLISVDEFGMTAQLVIFQFVYAFMQVSKDISPMIDRNLKQYRQIVCEFIEAHRNFWRAASQGDNEVFEGSFAQLVDSFWRMESMIYSLETLFGYCPAVHRECSIFYADFKHNVEKGHNSYLQAQRLTDAKNVTVSLFFGFSKFFHMPRSQKVIGDESLEASDKYMFLSLRQEYDDSSRSVKVTDVTTEMGSRVFVMERDKPRIKPVVDKTTNIVLVAVEILAFIFFIGCFISSHLTTSMWNYRANQYHAIQHAINQTLEFRDKLSNIRSDLMVLKAITDETWQEADDISELFSLFVQVHLSNLRGAIIDFRVAVESVVAEELASTPSIPSCDEEKCSLMSCASLLYGLCEYYQGDMSSYKTDEVAFVVEITYNTLINYTTYFYEDLRDSLVDHYESSREKLIAFYGTLAVVEIVCAFVFALATNRLVARKKTHAFDIIKTAQPPIMGSIASIFDRVLTLERQKGNLRIKRLPGMSIQFAGMFLSLAIYPFFLYIRLKIDNTTIPEGVLHPVIEPSLEVDYVTYLVALVEFQLYTLGAVNLTTEACYHKLTESDFSQALFTCPMFEDVNIIGFYALQIITMGLALAFFLWGIYQVYACKKMFRVALLLLKYFPGKAVQSNPMLNRIMKGESITSKEIHSFTREINADVDDLSFFTTVRFDENWKVTEIRGDIERILGIVPVTLKDIETAIIENQETDRDSVSKFFMDQTVPPTGFARRPIKKQLTVPLDPSKEVTLVFGKDHSLIIKDDSYHLQGNEKRRLKERLSRMIEPIQGRANKVHQCVLFVAVDCHDTRQSLTQIVELARSNSLFVVDERMKRVIVASTSADGFPSAISFANEVIDTDLRCVVHAGGPVTFRNPELSTRCSGAAYDELRLLLAKVPPGSVWVTDSVCSHFGKEPKFAAPVNELQITDQTTVKLICATDISD